MTDITDEQRAAVEWLNTWTKPGSYAPGQAHARVLLAALPSELTNPQPELPTEPGWYADTAGDPWQLTNDGTWMLGHAPLNSPENFAPFTRLVPERPQVTVEEVQSAITNIVRSRSFSAARLLSGTHVEDLATKLHAALVNGADK